VKKVILISWALFGAQEKNYAQNNRNEFNLWHQKISSWGLKSTIATRQNVTDLLIPLFFSHPVCSSRLRFNGGIEGKFNVSFGPN
jgi:hypothetical protein